MDEHCELYVYISWDLEVYSLMLSCRLLEYQISLHEGKGERWWTITVETAANKKNLHLTLQYRFSCMAILVHKNVTVTFALFLFPVLYCRPISENQVTGLFYHVPGICHRMYQLSVHWNSCFQGLISGAVCFTKFSLYCWQYIYIYMYMVVTAVKALYKCYGSF